MTSENSSDAPTSDAQSQPPRQPPVTPPTPPQGEVGPNPNDRPDNQQETARELAREFRWVEAAQLVVNGVLAMVGIIALCIYHGQLKVMQGQLGQMQSSGGQTDQLICLYRQQVGKLAQQVTDTMSSQFKLEIKPVN